jgi:predicted Zn-dependent peptidase
MGLISHEQEKVGSLFVHAIETTKYKTNTIVIMFKRKLEPDHIAKRALLPQVLKSGTKSLPTSPEIHQHLEELYGATMTADVAKKGEYQVLSFRMDIANEKFLVDQTPLLEKALSFLGEVILNPVTQGNGFKQDIVEKEKRVLKQKITSIYDDKMRYANTRLIEEMYKGELYAHHAYGKLDDVEAVNADELYTYYQTVIKEDKVDIYLTGDIEKAKVLGHVKSAFGRLVEENGYAEDRPTDLELKKIESANEVIEEQDVKQGKLHMGYRTYIKYGDPDYFALQVFNGVFGAFSHSKLFVNVREKASLAYYAVSRFESHIGGLFVMSGIESGKYDQTVEIINKQIESMRSGDFTDQDLEQTKAMLKNQILETMDNPNGLIEMLYHNSMANKEITVDEWLNQIEPVTKEQVVEVAKKVNLDTIYFLKGVGNS